MTRKSKTNPKSQNTKFLKILHSSQCSTAAIGPVVHVAPGHFSWVQAMHVITSQCRPNINMSKPSQTMKASEHQQ